MQSRRQGAQSGRGRCKAPGIDPCARMQTALREMKRAVVQLEEHLDDLTDEERVAILGTLDELRPALDEILQGGIDAGYIEAPEWWESRHRGGTTDV